MDTRHPETTTPSHPASGLKRLRSQGIGPEPLSRSMQAIAASAGYVTPERAARIAAAEQRGRDFNRSRLTVRLREECGVFPKYAAADLDDVSFVERVAPEDLAHYCAKRDDLARLMDYPGMYILRGENGPGKTHLASALVNRFCDLGRPARYTTAGDFFLELQSTFGEPGRTKLDLIGRYRAYELLSLDEIEVRSDSVWENNVLRGLIDARYASGVATLIITNKSEEEIRTYFSAAIRDRIREEGAVLNFDWRSLRGRKART